MAKRRQKNSMFQGAVKAKLGKNSNLSNLWPEINKQIYSNSSPTQHKLPNAPLLQQLSPDGEIQLLEYWVTDEPLPDDPAMPESCLKLMEPLYNQVHENPKAAIPAIESAIVKYPNVPQVYNYLPAALNGVGRGEDAEKMVLQNIEMNPILN